MRRQIPLLLTFLTGIAIIISFFIPHRPFNEVQDILLDWAIIISGFALLLGIHSLLRKHIIHIQRKDTGWGYSIVLTSFFIGVFVVGVISAIKYKGYSLTPGSSLYYVYDYMIIPLSATMFSLLAFFIASAAYRAFRARKLNATLLLIAAVVVMLGRVPIAENAFFKFLTRFSDWFMFIPQMAA
ncbi:MAG: hypothetical protein E3J87_08795, partial [Candidatus Cloacimonadota bacterium]